jgi:hypothetical protein
MDDLELQDGLPECSFTRSSLPHPSYAKRTNSNGQLPNVLRWPKQEDSQLEAFLYYV